MYGRWVPLLSGGLHCVQPAPRQRTAAMAIPAIQPWAPTSHWIVQAPVTLCFQWKIGNGKGRAQMEMKNTLPRKKLLRFITLKCASRLRPRRLKACTEHCCRWPHFIKENVLTISFYFSLMNAPFNYFEQIITFYKGKIILGDPGADSGGEGKSKRVGKNGAKKSKEREESARGQSFTRPVPNGRGRSGFWLVQETFVFFCPIRVQQTLESYLCVLTCKVHEGVSRSPCLSWLFAEALHKEVKRFNVRTKSKGKRSEYLRLSHRLMR